MKCLCSNENLEIRSEKESITIDGREYFYDAEFYFCPKCGEELYTAAQSKAEDVKIAEIKRLAAGFLPPSEIVSLRERHGLTQEQAAAIFGGGKNAFSKYERGEAYPSRAMDNLMTLFDKVPEARRALYEKANIKILDVEDIEIGSMNMTMDNLSKPAKRIPFPSSKNKNLEFELQM